MDDKRKGLVGRGLDNLRIELKMKANMVFVQIERSQIIKRMKRKIDYREKVYGPKDAALIKTKAGHRS